MALLLVWCILGPWQYIAGNPLVWMSAEPEIPAQRRIIVQNRTKQGLSRVDLAWTSGDGTTSFSGHKKVDPKRERASFLVDKVRPSWNGIVVRKLTVTLDGKDVTLLSNEVMPGGVDVIVEVLPGPDVRLRFGVGSEGIE
jgi:hypothetical protein